MSHTPSIPAVEVPESATNPRFSTSGILNAHLKEKYRQGLLSNYTGRTGNMYYDINKFANAKINRRDPSALAALEHLAKLYGDVANKSKLAGVGNSDTSSGDEASANQKQYNDSINAVNNYLKSYNLTDKQGMTKAGENKNYDERSFHQKNYGAANAGEVKESVANIGKTGETFNDLEAAYKKQQKSKKTSNV